MIYTTEKDVNQALKKLTVVVDTREQVNEHITGYFARRKIPYAVRKLDTGDYSATIGRYTAERDLVIERKANLDELAGNFTIGRQRLEDEFTRAKAEGIKVFLIIENASWNDVICGNYRSKLNPKSFLATLLSWQVRYDLTVNFCKPAETAQLIYGILYYHFREELKKGRIDIE